MPDESMLPQFERICVMKRVAWILTVLGILCFAAGQAQAHDWYHGGHHGPYHGGYCGPWWFVRRFWLVRA